MQADRAVGETASTSHFFDRPRLVLAASPDRVPPSAARSNIAFVTLVRFVVKTVGRVL
jgi:hypothetical protein